MEPEGPLPHSQEPVPILSQINPVQVSSTNVFKIHFNNRSKHNMQQLYL